MEALPPITVSRLDLERIERLLSMGQFKSLPGISELQEELDRANHVEPQNVPPDVVTMNSTVSFIEDSTGTKHQLKLVYPQEAGPAENISIFAPVGSALLGLSIGQTISWKVPSGRNVKLRVLDVIGQPEAQGQFSL